MQRREFMQMAAGIAGLTLATRESAQAQTGNVAAGANGAVGAGGGADAGGAARAATTPPQGFAALFNGRDFSGWRVPQGDGGHWRVVDGIIDYDGKSEAPGEKDLWTEKEYADFVLRLDWRWSGPVRKVRHPIIFPNGEHQRDAAGNDVLLEMDEAGDSGVYLRGNSKSQVNIWCWTCGSGEVYGYRTDAAMPPAVRAAVTPRRNADRPIGQWNTMQIALKDDRLTVVLNDYEVISNAQLPGVPRRGRLALQHHGDPIQFRDINIKEL